MSPETNQPAPSRTTIARARSFPILVGVVVMTIVIGCLAWQTVRGLQATVDNNPANVCAGAVLEQAPAYSQAPGVHPVLAYHAIDVDGVESWSLDTSAVPEAWQPETPAEVELVLCIEELQPITLPDCDDPAAEVAYGWQAGMRLLAVQDGREIATTFQTHTAPVASCLPASAAEPEYLSPELIWNWLTPYVAIPK